MKIRLILFFICIFLAYLFPENIIAESNRQERRLIQKGNNLYKESRFIEAQSSYEQALQANGSSVEARYNLGLSQIRQVANPADTSANNKKLVDAARKNFSEVASQVRNKPSLAAKANFNLGNIEFKSEDYQKAIDYYKQALRIDPKDDKARKNLRIAQKKLQQQNQDKKDNKQQENKQNKDQEKEQNKEQNQNNQNDKKQQNNLSEQAASQILQAIDNKESATRARVNRANKGEKSNSAHYNTRKW